MLKFLSLDKMMFKDLLSLSKFSLANGNAVIPLFQYCLHSTTAMILSPATGCVFAGSLFMAMSTQVFNQVIEQKQDLLMTRTCNRPMPREKITTKQGIIIGSAFYLVSAAFFWNVYFLQLNYQLPPLAFVINNIILITYLGIYTPLKQKSSINTLVGALVGALPVLLGTACVPGASIFDPATLGNFAFMLAWQLNHFYGIYWKYQKDYQRAGFQMLNDPNKAAILMMVGLVISLLSQWLTAYDMDSPLSIPLGIGSIFATYQWNYKCIQKFKQNPNVNANQLKMGSYYYFMVYYSFLLAHILYKKYKEYANKKQQQNQNQK